LRGDRGPIEDYRKIEELQGISVYESMEASHYRGKRKAVIDVAGKWKFRGFSVRLSAGGGKTVDTQWIR